MGNIAKEMITRGLSYGDATAFHGYLEGKPRRFSYQQLLTGTQQVVDRLETLAIQSGDRVLLMGRTGDAWVCQLLAILSLDCTAVVIDPDCSEKELGYFLAHGQPHHLIIEEVLFEKYHNHFVAAFPKLKKPKVMGQYYHIGNCQNRRKILGGDANTAVILYSSGTTDMPKGVMLTHHMLSQSIQHSIEAVSLTGEDRVLAILPGHHVFGLVTVILTPLSKGASIVLPPKLESKVLLNTCQQFSPTIFIAVPRVYELLILGMESKIQQLPKPLQWLLSILLRVNFGLRRWMNVNMGEKWFGRVHRTLGGKVRKFVSGGAPLLPKTYQMMQSLGWQVVVGYGLTETAALVTICQNDSRMSGTVGRPVGNTKIQIVNSGNDQSGEVLVQGATVMSGYFNYQDQESPIQDGWFHTGDLGWLDEEGSLHLTGRKKELLLLSNGKNVSPHLLESLYQGIKGIKDFAIVGVKIAEGEADEVHAFIVLDNAAMNIEQAKASVRTQIEDIAKTLPTWYAIQDIHFLAELPKTSAQKVKRFELAKHQIEKIPLSMDITIAKEIAPSSTMQKLAVMIKTLLEAQGHPIQIVITPNTCLRTDLHLDSLLMLELLTQINEAFAVEMTADRLIEATTIQAITHRLEELLATGVIQTEQSIVDPRNAREFAWVKRQLEQPSRWINGGVGIFSRCYAVKSVGQRQLPKPPFILAANHSSHLDNFSLVSASGYDPKDFVFMAAKDYFFNQTIQSWVMRRVLPLIPFDRSGTAKALMENLDYVKLAFDLKKIIVIYPEGTRAVSGRLGAFKSGVALFADRLSLPVVPASIRGTYQALPKGAIIPKSANIKVTFGDILVFPAHDESVKISAYQQFMDEVKMSIERLLVA